MADRIAAQEALARLGYDPGVADGVLGLKTRQAARQWQKSRSLPADGYLTFWLIQRLKADAAKVAPASGGRHDQGRIRLQPSRLNERIDVAIVERAARAEQMRAGRLIS